MRAIQKLSLFFGYFSLNIYLLLGISFLVFDELGISFLLSFTEITYTVTCS